MSELKTGCEVPGRVEKATKVFLTAEWRYLTMLNYEVRPEILVPFLPVGTELDLWDGKHYVSMVGFLFLNTKVRGVSIPFHCNFEELNLRFYVRRKAQDGWRRGVVFVKELVPRAAIAFVARAFYNENYVALPMSHHVEKNGDAIKSVEYSWRFKKQQNHLRIVTRGEALPLVASSKPEFITEHYWGYAKQKNGSTVEYEVEHPPWRVWQAESAELKCDVAGLYGSKFAEHLNQPPASAFLAEGSAVKVFCGTRI